MLAGLYRNDQTVFFTQNVKWDMGKTLKGNSRNTQGNHRNTRGNMRETPWETVRSG